MCTIILRFIQIPWPDVHMNNLEECSFYHVLIFYCIRTPSLKKVRILTNLDWISRSSRLEVFSKKGVLRNCAKFTGKHQCQSLFFNKVADLRPATLLQKETVARVFSCEFCKISKNIFSYRSPPVTASEYLYMVSVNTVTKNLL